MKLIPLTQGKFTKVNNEDFDWLSQWKWHYHTGYAAKGPKTIRMARLILNAKKGQEVDHKNLDKLDNQRSNLRLTNRTGNVRNSPLRKDSTIGLKGVWYIKQRGKFRARIQVNGKRIVKGWFNTAEEAKKLYDFLAKKYFGEFARLE